MNKIILSEHFDKIILYNNFFTNFIEPFELDKSKKVIFDLTNIKSVSYSVARKLIQLSNNNNIELTNVSENINNILTQVKSTERNKDLTITVQSKILTL